MLVSSGTVGAATGRSEPRKRPSSFPRELSVSISPHEFYYFSPRPTDLKISSDHPKLKLKDHSSTELRYLPYPFLNPRVQVSR